MEEETRTNILIEQLRYVEKIAYIGMKMTWSPFKEMESFASFFIIVDNFEIHILVSTRQDEFWHILSSSSERILLFVFLFLNNVVAGTIFISCAKDFQISHIFDNTIKLTKRFTSWVGYSIFVELNGIYIPAFLTKFI